MTRNNTNDDLVISIDTSEWPLLKLKPERFGTDEEMAHFIDCFEQLSRERKEPFVILLDLSNRVQQSKSQRAMISGMSKGPDVKPYLRGEAMIVGSLFAKVLFSILLAIGRPHIPIKPFTDRATAINWAKTLL